MLEWEVTRIPINQAELALTDTNLSAPDNWTASCVMNVHLVATLWGNMEF